MFTQLAGHAIWQGVERWQRLIDSAIDAKIKEVRDSAERQRKRIQERMRAANNKKKPAEINALSKRNASEEEEYSRMLTSSVANVLQQFCFYLINYKVDLEKARQLIRKYGKRYKVDPKKLFEMEIELQIQKPACYMAPPRSRPSILRKHDKLMEPYKGNKYPAVLALAIPYVRDLPTLRTMLILNKSLAETLKMHVFRRALGSMALSVPARVQIWSQILNTVFVCCISQSGRNRLSTTTRQ